MTKKKLGRPLVHKLNKKKIVEVCDAIAESEHGLEWHCRNNPNFPSYRTVRRWLYNPENSDFFKAYCLAKQEQADFMADQIIDIADNCEPTKFGVDKARLQIDGRKWIAAKLKPKAYGDRMFNSVLNKDGEIVTEEEKVRYDYTKLTMEELQAIKDLHKKCEIK